ncbi:MAG: nucleotidyl transferase AbiEii/AbiGii toxin family protein [Nanoarchaeota archaeon]|nr:nucleotidyl transferase AbiEii/AbiGii toxin family protein [Nanoarchaeota archaeon]
MVVKKELSINELKLVLAEKKFQEDLLVKDYYLTDILYLIKDLKGVYFKGGTALQKTILEYSRLSEDIDFTIDRDLESVKKEIIAIIDESKLFGKITKDKDVDGFVRLVVPYKSILGDDQIFIDLNERGKLLTKPELLEMSHFYPNIPKFRFPCLSKKEMIAEKVVAAIGRNKPRDHYDIYQIIKHKQFIDMDLVKKKCEFTANDPSILKMFNKAKKLHNKWNSDMIPLLVEEVSFQEVMQTLAKHFNLKTEKEKIKSDKTIRS